jgi:RsiW-degrading membrane proteinase PrsW (M82 family)
MTDPTATPCRVCEQPATHTVGTYALCEHHFALASRQRPHVWRTQAVAIGVLMVLVIAATLVSTIAGRDLAGVPLALVGLLVALVPAAVWLAVFYREDRVEPEPRRLVLGVFACGALLAAAVGIPLLEDVLQLGRWVGTNLAVQLLANILAVGLVPAALVFAAVRFTVYGSGEFDETTDGVIYGTAAGLGYATVLNVGLIVDAGGANLSFASIHVVLTALTVGGVGGLVGFFMSGQKLRSRPVWWSAAGVALGAILIGLYVTIRTVVSTGTTTIMGVLAGPWIGLILAVLLAGAITALLTRTIRLEITRATSSGAAE